jgi:hypothetical protein
VAGDSDIVQFIEMTGEQLFSIMNPDELNADDLKASGVHGHSIVRVNLQGDLEVRRRDGWEILGGLLGDFQHRVSQKTGLDWASPLADSSI